MDSITIKNVNNVYVKLISDPSIIQEIADFFTFSAPNAKFHPLVKRGLWDGKIRLVSSLNGLLYKGLVPRVYEFAKTRSYNVKYEGEGEEELSLIEAEEFFDSLHLPFKHHKHQIDAFIESVRARRLIVKSPTASGKSLIIYALHEWYRRRGERILIVVPTVNLVHQMYGDFIDYGLKEEQLIHKIFSGQEKNVKKKSVITTWQSIYELSDEWFSSFNVIIGDEAHLWKAKSLASIMVKCDAQYRFSLTGTLPEDKLSLYTLEGLFGRVYETTTTEQLIKEKKLASVTVKAITLLYDKDLKKEHSKQEWVDVVDWLVQYGPRNRFLRNLALSLKGNTLLLFQFVEKHGQILYDMIVEANKKSLIKKNVYLIHGNVAAEERERVRKLVEQDDSAIIIASFGTFSTGGNIVNLHNVVFASPFRSNTRSRQSIGRVLRKGAEKHSATVIDIADDVSPIFTKQFIERITTYSEENFPIKYYNIDFKQKGK